MKYQLADCIKVVITGWPIIFQTMQNFHFLVNCLFNLIKALITFNGVSLQKTSSARNPMVLQMFRMDFIVGDPQRNSTGENIL